MHVQDRGKSQVLGFFFRGKPLPVTGGGGRRGGADKAEVIVEAICARGDGACGRIALIGLKMMYGEESKRVSLSWWFCLQWEGGAGRDQRMREVRIWCSAL